MYNHFPVEKINHSLELIGVIIIMSSMDNYINLLNRNLGFLSSSCKLSTQILLKIYLNTQSIKLWHRTPFNLFCYLKQVNLQCFSFLWFYDTLCICLDFPILPWTGFKSCEVISCFYEPVLSHLTLQMTWKRFREGVAWLCVHTLRHTWIGALIRHFPSGDFAS